MSRKEFENLIDIQFFPKFHYSHSIANLVHRSIYTIKEIVEEYYNKDRFHVFKRFAKNSLGYFWKEKSHINRKVFNYDNTELGLLLNNEIAVIRSLVSHYGQNNEIKIYISIWLNSLFKFISEKYPKALESQNFESLVSFLSEKGYDLHKFDIRGRDKIKIRDMNLITGHQFTSSYDKVFKGLAFSTVIVYFFIKGK